LFFLDEMDASIPEVLVLLNAAIANRYFEFPNGRVTANDSFRIVAAGNTVGNGADEQYTGRLVLDQATLDRFAIIDFDYSLKVEIHLAKGNMDLVNFIRELRSQAKQKGVRATFSYRCITMVTKLESKLAIEDVMLMVVFKGMDKDTVNTFRPTGYSRYEQALRKVQA
jgi:MoxR-like ATPase